jgi:hypothetical protein
VGKNLKLGLAAVAVTACGALAVPQAVAVSYYDSHIGISEMAPAFHGDVDAESPTCVPSRHVRLYRKQNNHDKVLGNDETDATGEWAITEPGEFTLKSGVYYAKVTASLNMSGDRCRKDKSRKLFVD